MKVELTREVIWAAAFDAGDRSMKKAGRTSWSIEDSCAATKKWHELHALRLDQTIALVAKHTQRGACAPKGKR